MVIATPDMPTAVSLHPLRMRLVYLSTSSMFLTILLLPFLYLFNPPLDFDDFFRIIQQLLPVFVGFLLSAVTYAFATNQGGTIQAERGRMINFILVSSFLFYWVGVVALTALFLWSHSKYAPLNTGMSKDVFFTTLTVLVRFSSRNTSLCRSAGKRSVGSRHESLGVWPSQLHPGCFHRSHCVGQLRR